MHHCFPPVTRPDTRLLVLGSLPGAISLAEQRYYAHPRNLFWRLMSEVIGVDLVPRAYEDRLAALLDAKVGLWDTVAAATREGSLDASIQLHEASDLGGFAATLPALRAIGFNGKTSAKIGRAQLGAAPRLTLVDLPSSSPAHAAMSFEQKRDSWLRLVAYL
jgi:hypoxanthine-DNA glycosylase